MCVLCRSFKATKCGSICLIICTRVNRVTGSDQLLRTELILAIERTSSARGHSFAPLAVPTGHST